MSHRPVDDVPHIAVTRALSRDSDPRNGALHPCMVRGKVADEWTELAAGTGLSLYQDLELSALKGAWVHEQDGVARLEFLPLADGSLGETLRDGDDFRVMNRGVCLGPRGSGYCGSASSSRWGY